MPAGILYSGRKGFELAAVFFVARVVLADFVPKLWRVVHVIEVGEFMQHDIITQNFWHLH